MGTANASPAEKERLLEIERRRRQEGDALQRLLKRMVRQVDTEALVQDALEWMAENERYSAVGLYLLMGDGLRLVGHRGLFESLELDRILSLEDEIVRRAVGEGQPILVPDVSMASTDRPMTEATVSAAVVPLIEATRDHGLSQTRGLLVVEGRGSLRLDQHDLDWLTTVALQLSLALERTRLHEQLRDALDQEQSVRTRLIHAGKQAAIGRMVASIAHQLNNPLQTIKNCLYLIEQEAVAGSQIGEFITMSLSEMERLTVLVQRLREAYKPGPAGPTNVVDLTAIVEGVRVLAAHHLAQSSIQWVQPSRLDPIWIHGSVDQLEQVFLNLCLNAADAMQSSGGTLDVRYIITERQGYAGVEFRDMGEVISAENLPFVFDPFFTTKDSGMGLSMAISYDIVQNHGGEITVESRPGEGTAFVVWLPTTLQEG